MRNLNPDEIYDQVVAIDQQSRLYHQQGLSNIVFMGMGEPLMNYNNVLKAIDKITSISTQKATTNSSAPLLHPSGWSGDHNQLDSHRNP